MHTLTWSPSSCWRRSSSSHFPITISLRNQCTALPTNNLVAFLSDQLIFSSFKKFLPFFCVPFWAQSLNNLPCTQTHMHGNSWSEYSVWSSKLDLSDQTIRKLFPFWILYQITEHKNTFTFTVQPLLLAVGDRHLAFFFFNDHRYVLLAFILPSSFWLSSKYRPQTIPNINEKVPANSSHQALHSVFLLRHCGMMANNGFLNYWNSIAYFCFGN